MSNAIRNVTSAFLLAFAGMSTLHAQSNPSGPASVSLTTPSSAVVQGRSFTIDVQVDLTGLTGTCGANSTPLVLGGYQIPIDFTPARMTYVSAASCGNPVFNTAPTSTSASTANANGRLTIAASSTTQNAPTGKVCVARLTFQAGTTAGTTPVTPNGTAGLSLSSAFQICGSSSAGPSAIGFSTQAGSVTVAPAPSAATSTITATPASIPANGTSTSVLVFQAKDAGGNNLTVGGATVTMATTRGTLSAVTDNGNGTYSATLTSSTSAGTATVSGTLNATSVTSTASVTFTASSISASTSTLAASPASIIANGTSTSTVTIQGKDANGNNLTSGGAAIVLSTTRGTISTVTDAGNGTYTARLTSSTSAGTATVSGTINGVSMSQTATVTFTAIPVSGPASTMTTTFSSLPANGYSTSTILVQARDANGVNITVGGATVVLTTNLGSLGSVTDNGNGTYTAILTCSRTTGTATVTGTINGSALGNSVAVVYQPLPAGDANGDGIVTAADIFYLVNNLFSGGTQSFAGDANGDGEVTVADIFFLINKLFNSSALTPSTQSVSDPQAVLSIGTPSAGPDGVSIPLSVRLLPSSELGLSARMGESLQSFSFGVDFGSAPIGTVVVRRAGALATLEPLFESTTKRGSRVLYIVSFDQSTNPVLITDEALLATMTVAVGADEPAVPVRFDPVNTALGNQQGTITQSTARHNLRLEDNVIRTGSVRRATAHP